MADGYRVVITGMGVLTPLGTGVKAFWENLLAGRVAVKPVTRFECEDFPTRVAAQIDDFDPSDFMAKRRLQWTDRFSQLAVASAKLAIEHAQFPVNGNAADVGVYTGSALGGLAFAEDQIDVFRREGLRSVRPLLTLSVFGGA